MTVDTQQSLLSALHGLLTGDTALTAAMGTVKVYPVQAGTDITMPYIVHRIDMRATDSAFPLRQGTYIVDIWSDRANMEEAAAIRKAVIELLDNRMVDNDEVTACRLSLQTDGFIPEEPGIWHYVIQFNIRFYRETETNAIITRVDSS